MEPRTDGPKVAKWIETFCTLGGSFSGKKFKLLPFQKDVLDDIYLVDEYGRRLRRNYILGLPRKNGKSQLGSAIALYHLIQDGRDLAPLVVSAAGDRDQARLVFAEAVRMIRSNPVLDRECQIFKDQIRCARTGGLYKVVSADAGLAQGLAPSLVIMDEMHVAKSNDLFTALQLGSGMRNQPLTLVITTAGGNLDSPLGKLYLEGLNTNGHILNGVARAGQVEDQSLGMTWWGAELDSDPDPDDKTLWEKFNPAWSLMNIKEFNDSRRTTQDSEWLRYRMNTWTSGDSAWLPYGSWEALQATTEPLAPGDEVVLGFDGAWANDSTALVACRLRDSRLALVGLWEKPAHAAPDFRYSVKDIEEAIRQAAKTYKVRELVMDPYWWGQTLQTLADEGLPVVEFFTNSPPRMMPAVDTFYKGVMDPEPDISWEANENSEAFARHIYNTVAKSDARGVKLEKPGGRNSKQHIDATVAAVIAYSRAKAYKDEPVHRDPELFFL